MFPNFPMKVGWGWMNWWVPVCHRPFYHFFQVFRLCIDSFDSAKWVRCIHCGHMNYHEFTWIIESVELYIYIIICCIYIYRYDIDMVMIWWIHVDIMLIQSNCDPSDSKCGYIIYQYFDVLNTIYYIYIYYHFVFVCVWVCCLNCFHIEYHRIASNCHCALTKHTPILVRVNLMIW